MRNEICSGLDTVTISGREVSTDEACLIWGLLTDAERAAFRGLSDLQIVESIYTQLFSYGFERDYGAKLDAKRFRWTARI